MDNCGRTQITDRQDRMAGYGYIFLEWIIDQLCCKGSQLKTKALDQGIDI